MNLRVVDYDEGLKGCCPTGARTALGTQLCCCFCFGHKLSVCTSLLSQLGTFIHGELQSETSAQAAIISCRSV